MCEISPVVIPFYTFIKATNNYAAASMRGAPLTLKQKFVHFVVSS